MDLGPYLNKIYMIPPEQLSQLMPILIVLLLVDITLKGFALWRAAKNNQKYWFVALLIVNSVGILPAVYLLLISPSKEKNK